MKFITCEAPPTATARQKDYQWLYVIEGPAKVGDVVNASWGYEGQTYMQVTAVGTTRKAVGSEYTGAVKVVAKVEKPEVAAAVLRVYRAEKTLANARVALRKLRAEEWTANAKAIYGNVKVSGLHGKLSKEEYVAKARSKTRKQGYYLPSANALVEPSLRHYGG